jgi:hypothetical protein
MRIAGANIKGAGLYPVIQKQLQPTKHKYGASATWSQCTDTYTPTLAGHGVDAEINAFKFNFALTALIAPLTDNEYLEQLKSLAETGRVGLGLYFLTWAWENPNTKVLESLPVWSGTTFTQKEADLGIITQDLVGTSRKVNYYTINTPLYELSNGKYGYNDSTHQMGQIDVVTGSITKQLEWFKNLVGYYPSYSSYSYGRHILDDLLIPKLVSTRGNTNYGDIYGYDFERSKGIDRVINSTFNYNIRDYGMTEALNRSSNALNTAIANGGWYNDFSHWHWADDYGDKNQWEQFFIQQRNLIGSKDVVTLGFEEASEYMFLRRMVRRIGLFTDGSDLVIITDTKDNNQPALPLDRIRTSLSIDVDLTGTILEGKEVKGIGDRGIKKIGTNHFIVEVPYSLQLQVI